MTNEAAKFRKCPKHMTQLREKAAVLPLPGHYLPILLATLGFLSFLIYSWACEPAAPEPVLLPSPDSVEFASSECKVLILFNTVYLVARTALTGRDDNSRVLR